MFMPSTILLTLNLILFCLTVKHLWRQRRQSRMAFSGTNSRVNAQKNDRFKMYLKLFLLMAITSGNMIFLIFSVVLGIIDTWYILLIILSIGHLRAPLFFWICIWSRKNVRKAMLGAFTCHKKTKIQSISSYSKEKSQSFQT